MYAKIFSQIFDSSIAEQPEVRFTFMDMLVLADSDGVVDMTHEAIARRTNRPIDIIRTTITTLESPDRESRSPDADGRRIKRLDDHREWGWVIINFDRFRQIATEEQRKVKTRQRVHKYREKLRGNASVTPCNADVTPPYASPYPSVIGKERGVGKTNGTFTELEKRLLTMFKREVNGMAYEEQQPIFHISSRPKVMAELAELEKFRLKPEILFPESLSSLVNNWQRTLDRARNYRPKLTPEEERRRKNLLSQF